MGHINYQAAINYIQKTLPAEEITSIDEHLPTCLPCQEEVAAARLFLTAPQNLPAPSASLLKRVTTAFRRKQERLLERSEQKANLQFDSWSQLVAQGVRGVPQERQLLFHDNEFDLDLQVMNDRDMAAYTIRGQLLGGFADDAPDELEGITLNLINKANGQVKQGLTDQYGRFSFSQIEQADYELFVELKDRDLVINLESLSIIG
ncbi:MAG: carboxypeptidase-like regulatory domain-containing protein [Chloroflexota bacterium]|jgi:hypothetical protein